MDSTVQLTIIGALLIIVAGLVFWFTQNNSATETTRTWIAELKNLVRFELQEKSILKKQISEHSVSQTRQDIIKHTPSHYEDEMLVPIASSGVEVFTERMSLPDIEKDMLKELVRITGTAKYDITATRRSNLLKKLGIDPNSCEYLHQQPDELFIDTLLDNLSIIKNGYRKLCTLLYRRLENSTSEIRFQLDRICRRINQNSRDSINE